MEKGFKYYSNIDITRAILTIVLVLYHAFAPYGNGWQNPINVSYTAYWWLSKLLYNGFLEGFVLISGFCYANSCSKHHFRIMPKFKRLMLPSLFWSVIWLLLFSDLSIYSPLFWYKAINGAGHLWFLPMLFCCFVLQNYLIKESSSRIIVLLIFLSILPYPNLPLHINVSFHYLVYFNIGVFINKYYNTFISRIKTITTFNKISLVILYGCYLIASLYFKYSILENMSSSSLAFRCVKISVEHIIRMSQVLPMALLYFYFGVACSRYLSSCMGGGISKIAKLSFSIYILQEFILRFLYYKTSFCIDLGSVLYPWCGFVLSFFISYLLSWIFNHNKFTNLIIG